MNMDFKRKLPIPMETKEMYPLTGTMADTVRERTDELRAVLSGDSGRMILIIGPCSADSEDSVLDYVSRLIPVQEKVKDKIVIVPRVYTNKPRTTGEGYKGLVHQPDPEARPDLFKGIITTRELHMLGYLAVGARSVEDQQHRLTASAADCPVGMKNPTGGNLSVMMNGISAAHQEQDFIYRGWEGHSFGNPYAHAVLRGYTDIRGQSHPNYDRETLGELARLYGESGLENPGVIVDCSHANSGKDPFRQPEVMKEVFRSMSGSGDIKRLVKGFMVESYIVDGKQPVGGGVYGQSITDACLGWEKSERLIYEMAERL